MDWLGNGTWTDFWYSGMLSEPSFWVGTFIFCLIAYLIGSINGGQILSMFGKKNLGETGSKNFGATNAGRVYGARMFVFVFVFDMLKTVLAVLVLMCIATKGTFVPLPELIDGEPIYLFYYASIPLALMFVIIGHSFPIFFGFKGGKGVASSFGAILVCNWILAIIAISIFFIVLYLTRWTSWASIIGTTSGCLLLLVAHVFMMQSGINILFFYWTYSWLSMISVTFIGFLVVFRHRGNVKRMIQGKDPFIKPKGYVQAAVDE